MTTSSRASVVMPEPILQVLQVSSVATLLTEHSHSVHRSQAQTTNQVLFFTRSALVFQVFSENVLLFIVQTFTSC